MTLLAVIPARYDSRRLPGKPLKPIAGRPLIQHVYRATVEAEVFDDVVVATDDERIADAVRTFGGRVELTRGDHSTGTERVAEVAARHSTARVIANVQGDQPFVSRAALQALVAPFRDDNDVEMSTLATTLDDEDAGDPNVVKVVCGLDGRALYFSRAAIPHQHRDQPAHRLHHLGLYAFRRDALRRLAGLPPSTLERVEDLEQLRALENGFRIAVRTIDHSLIEVNTEDDLRRADEFAR